MKKIGVLTREKIVENLKDKISDTQGCVFISFNKVNAFSLNILRNSIKGIQAQLFVAKNSLFKKALSELGWKDFDNLLDAETGVVCSFDKDVVDICKTLVDFTKENETLALKGGVIKDKQISIDDITKLAKLPSKDILLGIVVAGFAAPISGFVNTLNQIILKFVWVVEGIKKNKEENKN